MHMKLFYAPGACSLAVRIVAAEAGIVLDSESVDLREQCTASGKDYRQVNAKGFVPALQLDDGEVLTEGPVVMQYLADLNPDSGLAPPNGTMPRYRLQEMLGYLNSEIHKTYSPLFYPTTPENVRAERISTLEKRYAIIEARLARHPWLVNEQFTVADAYLFTLTNWAPHVGFDISAFSALQAFQQRVVARPAVLGALRAEGLA